MSNVENQMTKECRKPKVNATKAKAPAVDQASSSDFFRHWDFYIRHSDSTATTPRTQPPTLYRPPSSAGIQAADKGGKHRCFER